LAAQSAADATGTDANHHLDWNGVVVIVLGIILLVLGIVFLIPILKTLGIIVLVIGAVFFVLGRTGRPVAGRRYWY
jgi:uncharacterized membrane protein HdeD (DUF308 family)